MRKSQAIGTGGFKAKLARAGRLSFLVWISGFLGFLAVASGFRPPTRMPHTDELFGIMFHGTLHAIPALVAFWVLGVPALAMLQTLSARRHGPNPIVCALVCCVVLGGSMVLLCTVMPGCSPRERVVFGILYGVVGLAGGVAYAWTYPRAVWKHGS